MQICAIRNTFKIPMPKWVSYDIFRHFKYYLSAAANRFAGLKMEEKMIFY
jgi:hypothetical protein